MKRLIIPLIFFLSLSTTAQQPNEKQVEIGDLKGTLTTPKIKTDTAILIIAGSGPTDRNGNSAMGLNNNSLKMLATELTQAGYAVLRYDKRGIAESSEAVSDQQDLRFEHFVEDAVRWLSKLKEEGYNKLIVAGHSQGSLVGMLAAQNAEDVIAFISISGLSEDAGEAIVRQLGSQSPALAEDARINIDSMKAGHTVKKFNPYLISIFGPAIQPFLKSYISYNPTEELKKLGVPVLLINGTKDLQIGVDQAEALKDAYPNANLLIIEDMNHVLKSIASDDVALNAAAYNNPELPLSENLVSGIVQFIQNLNK
ncbi:alpha/beta hydrolase [Ekhidna sp.]|uniref:alpha/beta hydrolase n=1 Tax=Ekhidna sp. TaxID=2608089 RepID=UPI003CCBD58B